MTSYPIIFSGDDKKRIEDIIDYANAHVVPYERLEKIIRNESPPVGDTGHNSIVLPIGYRAVYSVDEQKPGKVKHLSVSHGNLEVPSVEAVAFIMQEFNFTRKLVDCIVWKEKCAPNKIAINVCEPLDPDQSWEDFKKK